MLYTGKVKSLDPVFENLRITKMYDVYKKLLTKRQQEIITAYYFENLSLNEIAENEGITKQAVSDLIKRTIKLLEKYEGALNLCFPA